MRLAELPRCRQTDTAVIQPVRYQKDHKRAGYFLCSLGIYVLELSRLSQSKVFRKCVRLRDRHRSGQASFKPNSARPKHVYGLYLSSPSVRDGHHASSSEPEIHASWLDDDYSAGMSSVAFLCSFENLKFNIEAFQKVSGFVVENQK